MANDKLSAYDSYMAERAAKEACKIERARARNEMIGRVVKYLFGLTGTVVKELAKGAYVVGKEGVDYAIKARDDRQFLDTHGVPRRDAMEALGRLPENQRQAYLDGLVTNADVLNERRRDEEEIRTQKETARNQYIARASQDAREKRQADIASYGLWGYYVKGKRTPVATGRLITTGNPVVLQPGNQAGRLTVGSRTDRYDLDDSTIASTTSTQTIRTGSDRLVAIQGYVYAFNRLQDKLLLSNDTEGRIKFTELADKYQLTTLNNVENPLLNMGHALRDYHEWDRARNSIGESVTLEETTEDGVIRITRDDLEARAETGAETPSSGADYIRVDCTAIKNVLDSNQKYDGFIRQIAERVYQETGKEDSQANWEEAKKRIAEHTSRVFTHLNDRLHEDITSDEISFDDSYVLPKRYLDEIVQVAEGKKKDIEC